MTRANWSPRSSRAYETFGAGLLVTILSLVDRGKHDRAAAMLDHALGLVEQAEPSTAVFRARVGMTALDLADGCGAALVPRLRAALLAAAPADAYTARETLAHPVLRPVMTTGQEQALAALVEASGLGRGAMPQGLLDGLMASVALAENQLRALLDRPRSPVRRLGCHR